MHGIGAHFGRSIRIQSVACGLVVFLVLTFGQVIETRADPLPDGSLTFGFNYAAGHSLPPAGETDGDSTSKQRLTLNTTIDLERL